MPFVAGAAVPALPAALAPATAVDAGAVPAVPLVGAVIMGLLVGAAPFAAFAVEVSLIPGAVDPEAPVPVALVELFIVGC
jgi:hypothetical protein